MVRDSETFLLPPHEPPGRLQQSATELLAMPIGDLYFEDNLKGAHVNFFTDAYDHDTQRALFDRHDLYDRAKEVMDALEKLRSGRTAEVDKPLYPHDPNYQLTVRDALAQGPDIIKGLLFFEKQYIKSEKEEIINPINTIHIYGVCNDPSDINVVDDIRSLASAECTSSNHSIKQLNLVEAKFGELLATLPPKRRRC